MLKSNKCSQAFPRTELRLASPRVSFCFSQKINSNGKISEEESRRIIQFSKGYDLEGLTKNHPIQNVLLKEGKDYAKGIIKRYKDESFFNKYFTKLGKYYAGAESFLE